MSPRQTASPEHPLLAALAHGIDLLEAGAVEEAAAWLEKLSASCQMSSPTPVPAPVLAQSRQLLERATVTAMARRRILLDRLSEMAAARRARAYRAP